MLTITSWQGSLSLVWHKTMGAGIFCAVAKVCRTKFLPMTSESWSGTGLLSLIELNGNVIWDDFALWQGAQRMLKNINW